MADRKVPAHKKIALVMMMMMMIIGDDDAANSQESLELAIAKKPKSLKSWMEIKTQKVPNLPFEMIYWPGKLKTCV